MRKAVSLAFALMIGWACTGCIMVIGTGLHTAKVGKHKRIVEINDELYIVDLEKNTAKKLDSWDSSSDSTHEEVKEETTGN